MRCQLGQWPKRGLGQGFELPPPERKLVVALEQKDVDAQEQSPLYDGTIPSDIRKQIFDYVMAEYVEPQANFAKDTKYTRPILGKKKVSINLLLMCKRSYLETHHLLPAKKTYTFWHAPRPAGQADCGDERSYFRLFQPGQLALVKELHLFTQQFWLKASFPGVCRIRELQGIEKMKITLRREDWWWNEQNTPLTITPQRPAANDVHNMKADWRGGKAGEEVKWDANCWGSAFRCLKGLKELEMEFETYDYKEKELDEIVQHAAMWKFPMGDGKVLSSDGGIERSSWRGPPCGWYACPKCRGHSKDCRFCEEMRALRMEGKGPMLIVRSLTWKLADAK